MLKVLIVDDSTSVRFQLRILVEEAGHSVVAEAVNGVEAVEVYRQLRPNLVLLDIVMPELDGMQALEEIKGLDPDAKVVMVSSAATRGNIERAQQLGALQFVLKPFSRERISEVLEIAEKMLSKERAA